MSGQGWLANVGNNPNINREPPPPPLDGGGQAPVPVPGAAGQQHVVVEQQHQQYHVPIYGPPVPIAVGGFGLGAFPPVLPPPVVGVGIMDPFMFGVHHAIGGPLAPIRAGNFLPGAHSGIGFGLHAGGLPLPPPPPGAIGGMLPAFAPIVPPWTPGGGLAFGNVPAMGVGGGGGVGGGIVPPMGVGLGAAAPMQARPAPMAHDGNLGFPAQPEQKEITQIAGGIPPGVSLVEPAEHTIIIHIKGSTCPWLSPGAQFEVEALALASTTGLNRLIQVCNGGVNADECENTAVTECIELGNGLWEKGQTFKYNDAVSRVLTMKDAGWDNTRNRTNGQSLHLWGHRI